MNRTITDKTNVQACAALLDAAEDAAIAYLTAMAQGGDVDASRQQWRAASTALIAAATDLVPKPR